MTIAKSELKIREYDVYQAYYCGICKSIGRRLGQLPRMMLSYDSVFLALILSGISDAEDEICREHCITHHIKKKPVVCGNEALDYAADVMVLLAYYKFLDDWKDEKKGTALAGMTALSGCCTRLKQDHPQLCETMERSLDKLSGLEKEQCGNLDLCSGAFAELTEAMFAGFSADDRIRRILGRLGECLGRWIYVIDALDDYENDMRAGSYNPLIFRKNQLEGIGDLLYNELAEITKAYDLLKIKKNRGIIENIIFIGLRGRTDMILSERKTEHE
ncbi:MAG: DUF5685 family protein [Emergencia sp.]